MKANESQLLELRDAAFYRAVSLPHYKESRKIISDYLRALRNADEQYRPRLFHDMATIKHGFGILKTSYRKLMNRAHPGGHWS